jgi:hypothetical protein
MAEPESDQQTGRKNLGWVIFFIFLAVQSLPIIGWILSLPRDPKNSQFFGLSTVRLVLLLVVFGLGVVFISAAIITGKKKSLILSVFQNRWRDTATFSWMEAGSIFTFLAAWGVLVYLRSGVDGASNPVYLRMQPLLFWLFALGVQFTLWFWLKRYGWGWSRLHPYQSVFRAGLYAFIIFTVCGTLIWVSGLGITPDIFLWGNPGVPILAWQMCFALLASFLLLTILISFPASRIYQRRLDWFLSIGLFLLAVGLWLAQPIPRSYFFPSPRAPTFQIFPYSDAGFYDYASQSILIGEGFLNGKIVTRPLYILFLAVLHGIDGQNYAGLVVLQTLFLSIFPAALYWLGRSMRSREAGFAAGLLAIFRELNMIAATPLTEVSHSKMLMTDSLTGLGICIFCLVVFRWLWKPDARPLRALLIGGYLGLLQLLRSQALFLLPAVLLLLFLQRKPDWKGVTKESILFVVGLALAAAPWVIRNGLKTGDFALDQPSQAVIMAQRYSSSIAEANNLVLAANSNQVARHIREFTFAHPVEVIKFVSAHFINNEMATLSVLPLQASFDDYRNNFKISTLFWLDGVKGVSGGQWVLLVLNVLLVSIGLGVAANRWGWAGMSPLAFHLAYSFSSAAGRISGWRFIQPVDWVFFFYFCLGFSELVIWFFAASNFSLRPGENNTSKRPSTRLAPKYFGFASAAILFAGMLLPLAEWIVPQRYTPAVQEMALQVANESEIRQAAIGSISDFMQQPAAVQMVGRALYPRWYKAGSGEPGSGWAAYKAREQAHLGFMMVGPGGEQQLILNQNQPPADFTHASDVIIFGCQKPDFIDVRLVIGYNQSNLFAYKADDSFQLCE